MTESITTIYHGITIAYDERADVWRYVLRGREKSATSLANAKAAIDKPAPKDKKPFAALEAWLVKWSGDPELVTITALAERGYGGPSVWIKNSQGTRSKESLSFLFAKDANDAAVAQIVSLSKQQEELAKKENAIRQKLIPLKIDTTHEEEA